MMLQGIARGEKTRMNLATEAVNCGGGNLAD